MRLAKIRNSMGWKVLLGSLLGILTGGSLLAIAALTPRQWATPQNEPCNVTIYLSSDGFHTNLFVPVETPVFRWQDHLNLEELSKPGSKTAAKDYRYLQFGWGDRIFYMETPSWDQVHPSNALRALFGWNNATALFVKGHSAVPHDPNEDLKCVRLSNANYLSLVNSIQRSFQTNPQGQKQRLGSGQDQQSSFYAANGSYSILNTCNSWTADVLRAGNVNTPVWAGLAAPIMFHLRNGCKCEASNPLLSNSPADLFQPVSRTVYSTQYGMKY